MDANVTIAFFHLPSFVLQIVSRNAQSWSASPPLKFGTYQNDNDILKVYHHFHMYQTFILFYKTRVSFWYVKCYRHNKFHSYWSDGFWLMQHYFYMGSPLGHNITFFIYHSWSTILTVCEICYEIYCGFSFTRLT
jgi:hypothetical protein